MEAPGFAALVPAACRLLLRVFFRRVEVSGLDRVPAGGPVLFVANHVNSLIDPMLLLATLPRRVRFLAKSTLWDAAHTRLLVELAGAIPVQRRVDAGGAPVSNEQAFESCREELGRDAAIALFPEGVSHSRPHLVEMRTGAARIALTAEAPVTVVPVGLVFDERESFSSRALVEVGEPLDTGVERAARPSDPEGAVRRLTGRIGEALAAVTLNFSTWEEARLVERAAALLETGAARDVPGRPALRERVGLRRELVRSSTALRGAFPGEVAAVAARVRRYDRLLRAAGLRDDQLAARYPGRLVARFVARAAASLFLALPAALVGLALNAAPYRLTSALASRPGLEPDVRATWKLLGGAAVYLGVWAIEAGLAWVWLGPWAALAVLVAAPATGWAALRFLEQRDELVQESRAWLLLRLRPDVAGELRRRRDEVAAALDEVAAKWSEMGVRER
ncbi:MAG: lysophospholipid acyltransferase family protein [Acidobacteriota bacterium]